MKEQILRKLKRLEDYGCICDPMNNFSCSASHDLAYEIRTYIENLSTEDEDQSFEGHDIFDI
jgi:hypothetical protein